MEPSNETTSGSNGSLPEQGGATAVSSANQHVVQMAIGVSEAESAALIELKVKTLDHRLFRVTVRASSSVPQLKRMIEAETGVITDRQRLIFRGKVLKNENNLAFYALENGHTLHLVIRPADTTPSPAPAPAPTATTNSSQESTTTPAPLTNQADQETRRSNPSQAPPGTSRNAHNNDDPDPALLSGGGGSSMNRVLMGATISVPEGTRVKGYPLKHQFPLQFLQLRIKEGQEQIRHLLNKLEMQHLNASSSEPTIQVLTAPVSAAQTSQFAQSVSCLSNEFPQSLQDVTHTTYEADIDAFRNQLETFVRLLTQFQPRLERLPTALQELHTRQGDRPSQVPLVTPIVRCVEVLQSLGELCTMLSRISRRLFLRYNHLSLPTPDTPETPPTLSNTRSNTPSERPNTPGDDAPLGHRLFNLLERMQGRITRDSDSSGDAPTSAENGSSAAPFENRIEFEATIPMIDLIFPTVNVNEAQPSRSSTSSTRQWNFEAFGHRLVRDIPAVELYGLLSGSRDALHSLVQRVGMLMFEGQELPPMSAGTNREWSEQMVAALQDYVDALPRFTHTALRADVNLLSSLVHGLSAFAPELVVFFIRSTSVQGNSPNGPSFTDNAYEFIGHMARQIVTDTLRHLTDASALAQVLEGLLVHLSIERNIARFLIQTFQNLPSVRAVLTERSTAASRSSSRDNDTSEPESKRPRVA
ncbi:hypothetical protein Ae201684P_000928 [Aphanomyces euteiches]|nr:hypothetical protein Ae201684P_000928 [Aphanomyces euteiches]